MLLESAAICLSYIHGCYCAGGIECLGLAFVEDAGGLALLTLPPQVDVETSAGVIVQGVRSLFSVRLDWREWVGVER